jgi:hypothetical protein
VLVALAPAGYTKIAFPPGSAAQVVVTQLMGFGFTFAANVYVLLAVGLLSRRPTAAQKGSLQHVNAAAAGVEASQFPKQMLQPVFRCIAR